MRFGQPARAGTGYSASEDWATVNSSGVLMLSSARGSGCSSNDTFELMSNLRGHCLPKPTHAFTDSPAAGSQIAQSGSGSPSWELRYAVAVRDGSRFLI